MVRGLRWLPLLVVLAGCRPAPAGLGARYRLQGFSLVDVTARSEGVRDLWVVDGVLATRAPAGAADWPVLQGHGRWLLPGLVDASVAAWGNDGARPYQELSQPMGAETLLKCQLYAGVTRVCITRGARGSLDSPFGRGLRRCEAFGIPAAHGGVSSPLLAGPYGADYFSLTLSTRAGLEAALAVGPVDYLRLDGRGGGRGLAPPLLAEAVAAAHRAGIRAAVLVGDAPEGRAAIAAGADALMGPDPGPAAEPLFRLLAHSGTPWMVTPGLGDLADPSGPQGLLEDPLAKALADPRVLASFLDPTAYAPEIRRLRLQVADQLSRYRRSLAEAAALGVPLLAVSDAGWLPCAFQGPGLQRALQGLERAGVPPYSALAAVTILPARLLGRRRGFQDGDPADLLALAADPLADLANTEKISAVCIGGIWPKRDGLKPDLWRRHY